MEVLIALAVAWLAAHKYEQDEIARLGHSAKVTPNYAPEQYVRDDFEDDLRLFDPDHKEDDINGKGVILGDWDTYNGKGPAIEREHFEFDTFYDFSRGQDEVQYERRLYNKVAK
jgi:hypothetical protein